MESNKTSPNKDIWTHLYVNYLDDVGQAKFLQLNKEMNETFLEISQKRVQRLQCLFETCIKFINKVEVCNINRVEICNQNSLFELEEAYLKTLKIALDEFSKIEFIDRAKLKISMDIQMDSQEKNDLLSTLNIYYISKEEIDNYLDEKILNLSIRQYINTAEKCKKVQKELILIKNGFTGEKNLLECYQTVSDINKAYNTNSYKNTDGSCKYAIDYERCVNWKIAKMYEKPNNPDLFRYMDITPAVYGRQKGLALWYATRDLKTLSDLSLKIQSR